MYIQLEKNFANSKLSNVDVRPGTLESELESLRTEMNKIKINDKTDMSETDIILHILSNLSDEYEVAVSKIERKLKESSCRLNTDDLRAMLSTRYEGIMKHQENKKKGTLI